MSGRWDGLSVRRCDCGEFGCSEWLVSGVTFEPVSLSAEAEARDFVTRLQAHDDLLAACETGVNALAGCGIYDGPATVLKDAIAKATRVTP